MAFGAPVEKAAKKAQCLLTYLALHQGEAQARGKLVDLFGAAAKSTLAALRVSSDAQYPIGRASPFEARLAREREKAVKPL